MSYKISRIKTARKILFSTILLVTIFGNLARSETATGSGFFISESGHFITNYHVIAEATEIRVRAVDGIVYQAQLIKSDAEVDLALLKISSGTFTPITIGKSNGVQRGESVFALGFPQIQIQGLEPKLTEGVISSLSGLADDPKTFQISNPIQPGNSGGPLITDDGKLIGIVVSTLSANYMQKKFGTTPQNVNFAIKSNLLLDFLSKTKIDQTSKSLPSFKKRTEMVAQIEKSLGLVIASTDQPEKRISIRPSPLTLPDHGAEGLSYPTRAITLVVPFAAGGPSDMAARFVSTALSRVLKVPVVVQNVLGELGVLGTRQVLQSPKDGYTLLFQGTSLISASLNGGSGDDGLFRELTPIGKALEVPLVIAASPNAGITDLSTMQSYIRTNRVASLAHAGIGTISHLCALIINQRLLDGQATLNGFKGTAPALVTVLSGANPLICDVSSALVPQIKARNLVGIAIASNERLGSIYDVPTLLEQGSEGVATNWNGLFAPRGTPEPILRRISLALQIALRDENLRIGLSGLAAIPASIDQATPEFLSGLMLKDYSRYRPFLTR